MATTDRDFLILALEGLQARLDVILTQANAVEQAIYSLDGHKPKPRRAPKAEREEQEPKSRQKQVWTPAMRAAQAARARGYWKKGVFGPKKGNKAHKWTPAQRKRLSAAMKKVAARKAALPQVKTVRAAKTARSLPQA